MKKLTPTKIISIILILTIAIFWCVTIFNLSAMNSTSSNGQSTSIVEKALVKILDFTNAYDITNAYFDDTQIAYAAELINAPLRKIVHVTIYLILAILLMLTSRVIFGREKYFISCFLTLCICILFAMTDEFHQTFVDGRTGQFLDVVFDSIGACIGIAIFSTYFLAYWLGTRAKDPNSGSKDLQNSNSKTSNLSSKNSNLHSKNSNSDPIISNSHLKVPNSTVEIPNLNARIPNSSPKFSSLNANPAKRSPRSTHKSPKSDLFVSIDQN